EDHSSAKAVVAFTTFLPDQQACFLKHFFAIAIGKRPFCEMVPLIKAVAKFKFLKGSVIETALTEIAQPDTATLFMIVKQLPVVFLRVVHQNVKAVARCLTRKHFLRRCTFLNINTILLTEVADSLHVAHPFVLHHKSYGVATLA